MAGPSIIPFGNDEKRKGPCLATAPSRQDGHLQGHRAAPQHKLPVPAQDGLQQSKVQAEDVS